MIELVGVKPLEQQHSNDLVSVAAAIIIRMIVIMEGALLASEYAVSATVR